MSALEGKVAKAIAEEELGSLDWWDSNDGDLANLRLSYRQLARAAIAAVLDEMRKPSLNVLMSMLPYMSGPRDADFTDAKELLDAMLSIFAAEH